MIRGRQRIEFEGLLQKNVLGTFDVIRGFADLRDLAEVSVAMPYEGSGLDGGQGYQRELVEAHVEGIKRFLDKGRYRFVPEIVLSLRSKGPDDPVVSVRKRRAAEKDDALYSVRVNLKALHDSPASPIRRIDGNHRLEAARRLAVEWTRSATFEGFATASFCFVILNSDSSEDDDLAEAMLFNLVNSKALPIVSEHSVAVLMRDDGAAGERFDEDPEVYLTRWIRDRIRGWPSGFYEAMGATPLTRLHTTARVLLRPGGITSANFTQMDDEVRALFDPLYELAVRLRDKHEAFVLSSAFLPVAAEVYARHTMLSEPESNSGQARCLRAERWLRDFAAWFDRIGGADLPLPADPSLLWAVFKRDHERRARSVFIAMSFRDDQTLKDVGLAMREAIDQFNATHPNAPLTPIRVDEQRGASYEIPGRVFQDIDESRLVIADLTDERPNVYCEVGYAKSRGIPFILTFHKKPSSSGPPWDRMEAGGNRVHFDLAAFRHIAYDNPLHLRDQLKVELNALFDNHASV